MTLHHIVKLNVSNMSGLFQAINALDKQAYKSRSIVKTDWLFHEDRLGKFPI